MNKMVGQEQKTFKKNGQRGNFICWECSNPTKSEFKKSFSHQTRHPSTSAWRWHLLSVPCMASPEERRLSPAIHCHASSTPSSPSRVLVSLSLRRDLVVIRRLVQGRDCDSKEQPGRPSVSRAPTSAGDGFIRIPSSS